jgi:RHS repeat-associated protein
MVRKVVSGNERWDRTDYYYNESWQVLEERFGLEQTNKDAVATAVNVQWLWDIRYIDAPVLRWRSVESTLDETLYYCNDANMNVTALVSTSGTVVERYMYSPYGQPEIYDGSWTAVSWANSKKNEILYCGYRWDPETGMYQVRNREYHPTMGRWVTRDPIGYAYAGSSCNLYEYANSDPGYYADPLGAKAEVIDMDTYAPCGKFIIREDGRVRYGDEQQRSTHSKFGKGFEVEFQLDKKCKDACCDTIRLVQATKAEGAMSDSPYFETTQDQRRLNMRTKKGISPPAYPGTPGKHGPYSYSDAPLDTRNTTPDAERAKGGTTWRFTASAVCTRGVKDSILNSVNFTFDDGTKKTDVPGAKPHIDDKTKKPDGVEIVDGKPGYPWNDAMSNWIKDAGK